jgi:predicted alpha/beta hydrolase family esterase
MKLYPPITQPVRIGLAICFFVFLCSAPSLSQAQQLRPNSQVSELVESWQSIREQFRIAIAPFRNPEFEIRMLARGKDQGPLERLSITKLPERIILIVGGLQGDRESCEQFAMSLERILQYPDSTRLAVFDYPNDGSIQESGDVLKELLREMHRGSPNSRVSIVAHSMGGLVVRWAIETAVKPNEIAVSSIVDHLMMVCPPNHGSVLAQYADALEFADAVSKMRKRTQSFVTVLNSLIDDGLGEACDELIPGSEFLCKLNRLDRAKGVQYTIIAGTQGPIPPLMRLAGSVLINEGRTRPRLQELPEIDETLRRANELIASDELALGLGDGAVSLGSAQLPGVAEFFKLPIHHAEWSEVDKPQVQAMLQLIASILCRA